MNEKEYAKEIAEELNYYYKTYSDTFGIDRDIFPGSELSKLDLNKLKEELKPYGYTFAPASELFKNNPEDLSEIPNPKNCIIFYSIDLALL